MSKKRSTLLLFILNAIIIQSILAQSSYLFTPVTPQEWVVMMMEDGTNLSIIIQTVVTTDLPIKDIEIPKQNSSSENLDIYLCENLYQNRTSTISHVHRGTTWSYEPIYSDINLHFTHLNSRALPSEKGAFELVVAHDSGLTLLSKNPQEWSNYELLMKDIRPIELFAADFDLITEGEEILFIYEDPSIMIAIKIANFYLFNNNDSWVKHLILQDNPITVSACVGEFNTSNDVTEIMSIDSGGIVTLLQYQKGGWKSERIRNYLFEPPYYQYHSGGGVAADFYPDFLGNEFATGAVTPNKEFIAIFSNKTGEWQPEVIQLGNQTVNSVFINDLTVVKVPNLNTTGIVAVDSEGNVWLVYLTDSGWDVVKLWQDTGPLYAVQILPDSNSIIVGGSSRNLTKITSNFFTTSATTAIPPNTTTIIRSNPTTSTVNFSPEMGVLFVAMVVVIVISRKKQ